MDYIAAPLLPEHLHLVAKRWALGDAGGRSNDFPAEESSQNDMIREGVRLHHLQKRRRERLQHLQMRRDRLHPLQKRRKRRSNIQKPDMVEPLSAQELLVKAQVIFTERRTKRKSIILSSSILGAKWKARAIIQWAL